jgi:thiol-disulfide isomerase/thioredoxin
MPSRRQWLTGAVAGGAALAGVGAAWWHARAGAADELAPMWAMRFARPEGGELAMSSLRGKPLLINFWATWCAPCLRELPEFDQFHREYHARGWQVVGLAVDELKPVREFLERVKIGFPVALAGLDGTDLIAQLGNLQGGLPFSVMINADGQLTQRRMGETHYKELVEWAGKV